MGTPSTPKDIPRSCLPCKQAISTSSVLESRLKCLGKDKKKGGPFLIIIHHRMSFISPFAKRCSVFFPLQHSTGRRRSWHESRDSREPRWMSGKSMLRPCYWSPGPLPHTSPSNIHQSASSPSSPQPSCSLPGQRCGLRSVCGVRRHGRRTAAAAAPPLSSNTTARARSSIAATVAARERASSEGVSQ
jgi:hypothetical protein